MNRIFVLRDEATLRRALAWLATLQIDPGRPLEIEVRGQEPKRSQSQSAALWAALGDIAEQVVWHGLHYTAEDWKDIITAGLKTQRFAPGIEGGIVALGISTSRMKKQEFSDLLDYVHWFGAEHGVKFSTKEAIT
jgi:hypothetical protein